MVLLAAATLMWVCYRFTVRSLLIGALLQAVGPDDIVWHSLFIVSRIHALPGTQVSSAVMKETCAECCTKNGILIAENGIS